MISDAPAFPLSPYTQTSRPLGPGATEEAKAHPLTLVKQEENSREQLGQREKRQYGRKKILDSEKHTSAQTHTTSDYFL